MEDSARRTRRLTPKQRGQAVYQAIRLAVSTRLKFEKGDWKLVQRLYPIGDLSMYSLAVQAGNLTACRSMEYCAPFEPYLGVNGERIAEGSRLYVTAAYTGDKLFQGNWYVSSLGEDSLLLTCRAESDFSEGAKAVTRGLGGKDPDRVTHRRRLTRAECVELGSTSGPSPGYWFVPVRE